MVAIATSPPRNRCAPAKETFSESYTLDMTGNWPTYLQKTSGTTTLNQSRGHNVVNEVTSATSWATPAHDRVGNMTTVPKPSSLANGLTLKFDAWNRVVEVKDGATVVGKYEYDAIGRRVKRHIDSQSPSGPNGIDRYEHLFYDDAQVIETRGTTTVSDHAENLQPKYQYVWSLRYIDAPILRDENTDNDSLCDDARIYFLNDANMNVTSLVDTAGDALERYGYDPYGRVTIYDATWSNTRSTSNYSNTTLYTGRDLDPETGLCFYRARYYSAELGRFVGRDPIGYDAGIHLYLFLRSAPPGLADPFGMQSRPVTSGDEPVFGGYPVRPRDPTVPQDPKVLSACCARASRRFPPDQRRGVRGFLTCCNGDMTICVNVTTQPDAEIPTGNNVDLPVLLDAIVTHETHMCLRAHEQGHADRLEDCSEEPDCVPLRCPGDSKEDKRLEECRAYQGELDCLARARARIYAQYSSVNLGAVLTAIAKITQEQKMVLGVANDRRTYDCNLRGGSAVPRDDGLGSGR